MWLEICLVGIFVDHAIILEYIGFTDFSTSSNSTRSLQNPDNQYIFSHPEDDDYEDEESTCQASRRTIQPKALNNIYNKLTKVVNTASFVQSINIEQCL